MDRWMRYCLLAILACFAGEFSVDANAQSMSSPAQQASLACFVPPDPIPAASPAPTSPEQWKIPLRSADEMTAVATLEAMNACSMGLYRNAHLAVRRQSDPLVITRFSGATLFVGGQPIETRRVIPSTYHNLRYASHVPLAIYVTLATSQDKVVDEALAGRLRVYASAMQKAEATVDALPLSADQIARQHRLLQKSLALLRQVKPERRVDPVALATYARAVSLDMEQNIRDAGRAQVDGLHEQMLVWRKTLSDEQWCRIRYVVRGFQQARSGHAAVQYFAALANDHGDGRGYPGESEWVAYREDNRDGANPWDPELDLLATVDLDAVASRAVFSDSDRLTVDVTAHGARERIRELDLTPLSRAHCNP